MKDYLAKFKDTDIDSYSVIFYFNDGKAFELGKKIENINPSFVNNGYGWEKIVISYFEKNHNDIFNKMETDPEPTMLTIYFELTKENDQVVKEFISILEDAVEHEKLLEVA